MCLFFHREDARLTHIFKVGDRVWSTSTCCLRKGTPHPLKNQRARTFKIRVHPGFLPLAQSPVLLCMIVELATSLVALMEAKSSRKLTAKCIGCQNSQFWVI